MSGLRSGAARFWRSTLPSGDCRKAEGQRALVAANIENLKWGGEGRGNQYAKNSTELLANPGVSRDRADKLMDVGRATVTRASVIKRLGSPNVVDAVQCGMIVANIEGKSRCGGDCFRPRASVSADLTVISSFVPYHVLSKGVILKALIHPSIVPLLVRS